MARTLAQERSSVRTLAGLTKATPAEVDDLIIEGHRELCVRAEWTRATLELGPTVADEADYALPATVYRPLEVYVNGAEFKPFDQRGVRSIIDGDTRLVAWGVWYLTTDENGVEYVSLYPVPDAGLSIEAFCTVYPTDPTVGNDNATFAVPDDFMPAVRSYVKAQLYSDTEDDEDRAQIHQQAFENGIVRLRQHRTSRRGHGPVQMGIEGVVR